MTESAQVRQARRLERQQAILAGAARAFAGAGFASTSMDEIAQAAGVSKLVVYRYFDSKDELYRAVLRQVCERLSEAMTEALDRGEHDRAGVGHLMVTGREYPDAIRLLWRHAAREPEFASYPDRFRTNAKRLIRGELESRIPDPLLLDWAAEAMTSFMVEGVLLWLDRGDAARDDELVGRLTESCWALADTWARPARSIRAKGRRLATEEQIRSDAAVRPKSPRKGRASAS